MSFVATAIVGGSLISGGLGYLGATNAANAQVSAENNALAAQNAARSTLNPFINVGTGATYTLGQMYGIGQNGQPTGAGNDFSSFTNSPDYQFALQQGNQATQNYLNASGLGMSGAGLTAISNFNQGLASQQFGNYFNRLMGLSNQGMQAATAGVSGANAAANTMGNIGASQASGIIGGTNALTGGINSGISNSLLYSALRNTGNPSGYQPMTGNPTSFPAVPFFGQ